MSELPLEEVAGWGRHPVARARVDRSGEPALPPGGEPVIARGLGRAYGDAALPASPGGLVVECTRADRILGFDGDTGRLTCEAGLSLAEILRVFVPRGWFPPVTPGTKFVTVGACVACDVHGKNHHRDGSFGTFVERLVLVTADGRRVECGPTQERELFLATVGGMGLTGLIVEVTLRLRRVESPWIVLETVGVEGLEAMLAGLKRSADDWPYTVGWIDCLARGSAVGRGILMRGRHATAMEAAGRRLPRGLPLTVPVDAPEWLLNPLFMRWFNYGYYRLHGGTLKRRVVSCDRFFYPLDAVGQWNRL
ncbi:MAG: FAD-binding protein, partial [Candidatus Rokuibacteriota bacterium]